MEIFVVTVGFDMENNCLVLCTIIFQPKFYLHSKIFASIRFSKNVDNQQIVCENCFRIILLEPRIKVQFKVFEILPKLHL